MIKEIEIQELTLLCVQLVSRTLVELGQVKDEKHIVVLSQSLSNDLKEDFANLTFEDIQQSFRQGVRNTDRFVLNVQTYYKWIKDHKKIINEEIWKQNNQTEHRPDKRLNYRSRNNTGITSINKLIK
jgi:hypothetical protein